MFINWMKSRLQKEELSNAGTAEQFFYDIIDNPTNLSIYMIAADFLQENGLEEFGELIRLCVNYGSYKGKERAKITRRITQLYKSKPELFDKIHSVTFNPGIKNQMYMLQMHHNNQEGETRAYTYDTMRDKRKWVNNKPPAQYQDHPNPDVPFIQANHRGFHTGKSISTFPPEIIGAMIFYVLLTNNPEIMAAIKQSKALSIMKPFATHMFTHNRVDNPEYQ